MNKPSENIIKKCFVPQLNENATNHAAYSEWHNFLNQGYPEVEKLLEEVDLTIGSHENCSIIASLVLLFYELQSNGPWQGQEKLPLKYSERLNNNFDLLHEISLDKIFTMNSSFDIQQVFEICLQDLHRKLTCADYKKHPSLIEVYCKLVQNLKVSKVTLVPTKILPIALLLIEDVDEETKIKGLTCCSAVLDCLLPTDFGTYYEVLYNCLKKVSGEKDLKLTELSLKCLTQMLDLISNDDAKINIADDIYLNILEQLQIEANLYRKGQLITFTKSLIKLLGVNCVKRKAFKTIMCLNLDICCEKTIGDILLIKTLECLEEWIKYGWCVWQLQQDQQLLAVLFKCLYVCGGKAIEEKIIQIISTLVNLCSKSEQILLLKNFEKGSHLKNQRFNECIKVIKQSVVSVK